MKLKNGKDKLFTCGLLVLCVGLMWLFHLPCPVSHFLHVPCPGCGMTRAYLCLLRLDMAGAFRMHPMFWSVPVLLGYYLTDGVLIPIKWLNNALLIAIGGGFLVNWVCQLITR